MRDNINKVSQRGERLDALQDKTDNLAVSAQGFRRGANRVRKQMWWKDMKMRMCLIAGIIILLCIIIIPSGKGAPMPLATAFANSGKSLLLVDIPPWFGYAALSAQSRHDDADLAGSRARDSESRRRQRSRHDGHFDLSTWSSLAGPGSGYLCVARSVVRRGLVFLGEAPTAQPHDEWQAGL